ncbi:MAG: Fe(3+) ABC transporter substrate-binding protein [Alphaproteobacteria bacterium]
MHSPRARIPFGLSLLFAAAALVAMFATMPASAQGVVNLYTARHYDSDHQLYADFTKRTGVKVNVVQAGGNELIQRVEREGRNSPADVLMAADAAVIGRAQARGLFRAVESDALEKAIPANLREPEGYWFGFTTRARVIMYNKALIKPEQLSTYEDLADPKWKGKLLVNSSNTTYNQSLVASMVAQHGVEATEAWARGIVANMAREPKGADTEMIGAVYKGEFPLTVANTYYLGNLLKANPDVPILDYIGVFFPNQTGEGAAGRGAHVNVSGGGLLRYAPNRANAIKFLEFLATPEAQRVFADGNSEYPVVPGVEPAARVKAFGSFKMDQVNISQVGKNNIDAVRLMDRVGWK